MRESDFERKCVKWLKEQGAYVIKCSAGPGVPVGCPDRIALYRDKHAELEFKRSATAPFRPGQRETLLRLANYNNHVYVVHPDNWEFVKQRLLLYFF